MPINPQR